MLIYWRVLLIFHFPIIIMKKKLLFQELSPHYKFQSSIDHLRFHPIHLPAISSEEFPYPHHFKCLQLSQILNLQKQKLPGSCLTALIDSIVNLDELRQAPMGQSTKLLTNLWEWINMGLHNQTYPKKWALKLPKIWSNSCLTTYPNKWVSSNHTWGKRWFWQRNMPKTDLRSPKWEWITKESAKNWDLLSPSVQAWMT